MSRIINQSKEEIIGELELMKDYELSVKDLYIKITNSPDVEKHQQVKDAFTAMAKEEQNHADIVQKIINIVTYTL